MNIAFPKLPEITEEEYWIEKSKGPKCEPLAKSCRDCAVTTGFYIEFADMLLNQPKELQEEVMDTWYCHNACNRGCKGIRDYINNKQQTIMT